MTSLLHRATTPVGDYVGARVNRWRTGSSGSQLAVAVALIAVTVAMTALSLHRYSLMPLTTYVVPMLLGSLTLRHRPLLVLLAVTVVCVVATVAKEGINVSRLSALVAMAIAAVIIGLESRLHRSGLPGPLGEAMLVDLRDRLQSQGVIPALPAGWTAQSAMLSAGGAKFAGDFFVADLTEDREHLEMVLVDVCGKGVSAGTQSLQFAGALGGLIGALPPQGLFAAANAFLLRQNWDDGFATAVHVLINLATGEFVLINAGHPPALRWEARRGEWAVDGARGMALGIEKRPDFHLTSGRLEPGDALMFYTDGVVESHSQDFTTGIEKLRRTARTFVRAGFDGAAGRILSTVRSGDDDRAVLILHRLARP